MMEKLRANFPEMNEDDFLNLLDAFTAKMRDKGLQDNEINDILSHLDGFAGDYTDILRKGYSSKIRWNDDEYCFRCRAFGLYSQETKDIRIRRCRPCKQFAITRKGLRFILDFKKIAIQCHLVSGAPEMDDTPQKIGGL